MRGYSSQRGVFAILVLLFVIAVHSASVPAPRCNARANSTVKITVIPDQRVRRADDSLGQHTGKIAPRCNARANSTVKITVVEDQRVRRAEDSLGEHTSNIAPRCNARLNSTINATVIHVDRIRRADNSPGGQSSGSASSQGEHPGPPPAIDLTPYIQAGQAGAAYLRASDQQITVDLIAKGKLKPGEQLASKFTDVRAFRSSGWDEVDETPRLQQDDFIYAVPFPEALQSLGISDKARPSGRNKGTLYKHTIPWTRDSRQMMVSVFLVSQ